MRTMLAVFFSAMIIGMIAACYSGYRAHDAEVAFRYLTNQKQFGGMVFDKESADVMWESQGFVDACQQNISRTKFLVLNHNPGREPLELFWSSGSLKIVWNFDTLFVIAPGFRSQPINHQLGMWYVDNGSILDTNNPYITLSNGIFTMTLPEYLFPSNMEFAVQAVGVAGTSHAWRIRTQ